MNTIYRFLFLILLFSNLIEAKEKVSVQLLWKHQFEFAGFYIAKEKGFYKDAGLDVEIKEFDFGIDIVDDVLKQKSSFGIGRSSLILNKLQGKEIVLINAIYQSSPYMLISKKRPDLSSVNDFKNKKIMLSDDLASIAAISAMMKIKNVNPEDYTAVPHSFDIHDILNGKADLMTTYISNEPYELDKEGIEYTLFNPKDFGFDFYADIIFTSKKYLNDKKSTVDKFQEATVKGWLYAFENIDEATHLILKKYNTQNKTLEALRYEAEILKDLALKKDIPFGHIDEMRVKEIASIYKLLELTNKQALNIDEAIYKNTTIFERFFTKEALLYIAGLILLAMLITRYRSYLLQKQNKLLENKVKDKTAELQAYTKELEKQKDLYDIMFDNASNGVLIIDLETQKFIDCNNKVVHMLGMDSKEEVLNTFPHELSPPLQADGIKSDEKAKEMISIAIEKGYTSFNWTHLRKHGETFWVEVSLTKIKIEQKELLYVTWKDIDSEMQAKKELEQLNQNLEAKVHERTKELEIALRSKSEFLANMSHEIRTPLNGIIGFIDILYKNEEDAEKREKLLVIKDSGKSLLTIINDILDFSKLDSKKVELESIPFYTVKPFKDTVNLFYDKAGEKNISIELRIDEKLPEKALGDITRIKQIFSNLLSNAIKFSHEDGKVLINLNYDKQTQKLHCEIIDEGIGISEENAQKVFNYFEQADSSVTRSHGGTGLGLAISKALINQMGGEISLKSELGKGSTFFFDIQLPPSTKDISNDELSIHSEGSLQGNILIVEDNKTNQMLLTMLLDEFSLSYEIANDGLEAIRLAKSGSYDLILMDENMPNMSGMEATKKIKELEHHKDTPIIAVTANALKGDEEKFLKAGMSAYLAKPIDSNALTTLLHTYL